MANERTTYKDAFKMADNVLYMGVRGVTDLMVAPGLVNLDFADIRTVMAEMGKAMMGTGEAEGEDRARLAAEAAISNPLLEDTSMAGARGLLINITGGDDLTLFEVDQAANRIREEVAEDANIIFGSAIDPDLDGKIRVSVVATGIDMPSSKAQQEAEEQAAAQQQEEQAAAAQNAPQTGGQPPMFGGGMQTVPQRTTCRSSEWSRRRTAAASDAKLQSAARAETVSAVQRNAACCFATGWTVHQQHTLTGPGSPHP